jgi:hypothetical protein
MGTRSTYRVIEQYKDDNGKVKNINLVLVYLQFDGYPEGHPLETAEWLVSGTVVNGLSMNEDKLVFNGAGCLAAQLITKFKVGVGGTYIHSLTSRGWSWENYTYDIIVKEDKTIEYVCYDVTGGHGDKKPRFKELYRGTPEQFIEKYSEK